MREFKREIFPIIWFDFKENKIYYKRIEANKEFKYFDVDCITDLPKWLDQNNNYKYIKITYYLMDDRKIKIEYELLEENHFCYNEKH